MSDVYAAFGNLEQTSGQLPQSTYRDVLQELLNFSYRIDCAIIHIIVPLAELSNAHPLRI